MPDAPRSEPTPEENADPAKAADWLNDVFGMRDGTPRTVVVGPVIEDELQRVCAQLRKLATAEQRVKDAEDSLRAIVESFDACPESVDYQFWNEACVIVAKGNAK